MLNGIMLLWFILTAMAVAFVAIDIRSAPIPSVMKWGFVLLTAYTGPIGVFLYVLGCREPLSGLHEDYVAARWRQVLGSTMHCVAGDGIGILAGAVIGSVLSLDRSVGTGLEYVLGFGFGWTIFQALFMRGMTGGSYRSALGSAFLPEFLSMNFLMAGMMLVASLGWAALGGERTPLTPEFWFVMSMALLAGFIVAYPLNWWLVAKGLKHGMSTVRDTASPHGPHKPVPSGKEHAGSAKVSSKGAGWMATASIAVFALAFAAASAIRLDTRLQPLASINPQAVGHSISCAGLNAFGKGFSSLECV